MAMELGHLRQQPDAVVQAPGLGAERQHLTDQKAHMLLVWPRPHTQRYVAEQHLHQPAEAAHLLKTLQASRERASDSARCALVMGKVLHPTMRFCSD